MIKVSDYVIKYLEDYGIKHIFTLSGGGIIHLIDSLGKSKKIQYICNLHEQGAGIAAESYAQYTNDMGVALVTTGPGGTNIITAVAGAWLDSTPMLVICGQVNTKDRVNDRGMRQNGFQEIDMVSLVKPITKYASTIKNPMLIKKALQFSIHMMKENRPGPVVLEIPLDIQSAYVDENKLESSPFAEWKPPRNVLADSIAKNILDEIKQAKRPILLAGNGIRLGKSLDDFYGFINKTKIPVLLTWKSLDFLEEDHPLFVGRPGSIASRGANFNQQNADLIICIGARLDHGQIAYQQKYFAPKAKKIIIDVDNKELLKFTDFSDMSMNGVSLIWSDASDILKELNKQANNITIDTSEWLSRCKKTYKKYPLLLPEYYEERGYTNAYVFMDILSKYLPENSLVIPGSSGTCSEVTMQAIKIKKGTRVYNTEGLGSMGFGVPAAIGGCLASGNRETICIDGDGSFFMNVQELEVVRRVNLPIKFFVLNNNGYGTIKTTQNNYFAGVHVASDPSCGLTLPDIELTAQAYGINYDFIGYNDHVEKTLRWILKKEGPLICEVMLNSNHQTLPKTSVFKNEKGEFEALPMEDMKPFLPRNEFYENLIK